MAPHSKQQIIHLPLPSYCLADSENFLTKNPKLTAKAKQIKKQLQAAGTEDSKEVRELKYEPLIVYFQHRCLILTSSRICFFLIHTAQTATQPDSISRPRNLLKVTVGLLRQHLGLEGTDHKMECLRIRVSLLYSDNVYSLI